MNPRTSTFLKLSVATVMMAATMNIGCTSYRPAVDPSPNVSLPFRGPIATLAVIPRAETLVDNGINQTTYEPQPNGVKEWFFVEKNGITFGFNLFFTEEEAKRYYHFGRDMEPPVFEQRETPHTGYCISYLKCQDTHAPLPFLRSAFGDVSHGVRFRTYNLMTTVWFLNKGPDNEKLNWGVKELGRMLESVARAADNMGALAPAPTVLDLGLRPNNALNPTAPRVTALANSRKRRATRPAG